MKKMFIMADIHGHGNKMESTLLEKGFDTSNPDHIFVSLGDLLDRGSEPYKCLQFVNSLPRDRKILIRGNHEDLLESLIARGEPYSHDISNGTYRTALALSNFGLPDLTPYESITEIKHLSIYRKYMDSLVDFYEDSERIFVHGWIPCISSDSNKCHSRNVSYTFDDNWRSGDWEAARWINGMNAALQGIIVPDKTIYCGHWHTSYGWALKDGEKYEEFPNPKDRKACEECFATYKDNGIVALDACTAYSGIMNCEVVEIED